MTVTSAHSEFCNECGKYVIELDPNTGWCLECSGLTHPLDLTCVRCHKHFKAATERFICIDCEHQDSNSIEVLLHAGFSITRAKTIVREHNVAHCLSCGDTMPNATLGRHFFCTKRTECRRASRRLRYFRQVKGMSYQTAFNAVLLTLEKRI